MPPILRTEVPTAMLPELGCPPDPKYLNTPRLVADANQLIVWKWDQQEPFGNNPVDENPSGLGTFDLPLRLPGQNVDRETARQQNHFPDYDPALRHSLA